MDRMGSVCELPLQHELEAGEKHHILGSLSLSPRFCPASVPCLNLFATRYHRPPSHRPATGPTMEEGVMIS